MDFQPLASVFVLALLGFSSFFFLPPSIGGPPSPDAATTSTIANEPLQPMTANKLFNTFASCFQNQCSGAIRYLFKPTGFAAWHNVGAGNVTLTGFSVGGQSRSVSAFSNSTTIDYRITVPNVVTMDVYFKEKPTNGRPSNTFKVTMVGTSSVSGTFTWNFGNPQSFPATCDNTKHILTYGMAGLNFTDATNFSATCTTTSVSFTIGVGAFRIDPTTVTTTGNINTDANEGQTAFGLINTRYWIFYDDGTNCNIRSSLDGATWSSATAAATCASSSSATFDTVINDATNRFGYTFFNSGSSLHWRTGILNSDGTVTWDFAEQTITLTGTTLVSPTPRLVITPAGDLVVAVGTSQAGTTHYEVWKCTGATSSCTPSKIQDTTSSVPSGGRRGLILLSFSDSSLGLLYGTAADGVVKIQTCPSTCATSTDWSALTTTTSSCDAGSGAIAATSSGTTIYFGCKLSAAQTIKYWSCAYPCSSTPTETTLTSSATTLVGLTISTDKFQSSGTPELAFAYGDSSANTISYIISFNGGSTWSPKNNYVTSETTLSSNVGLLSANKKILKGTLVLAWRTGTVNPFNLRFTSIGIDGPYIIQSTSCTGTGSTVNCAFASNTKAGSSLVVFAGSTATTTVSGVTDTQSLTYSQIVGSDVGTVGDSEAWWACHPSTAAADTVTVSYSLSVTATIILYELHGRPTGTSCGPSSSTGSSASSSTAAVGSYTPRANAFIIGALDSSCQVACTITAGSGYSLDFNVAINAVNDFTTEYFWNVATADTTPYTFSVASAYNEISVAFYDLVWANSTLADSAVLSASILRTPIPSVKDSVSLSDAKVRTFIPLIADSLSLAEAVLKGEIITLKEALNVIVTIPTIAGGTLAKNSIIEPNLIMGNAVAMLAMLLIPVGVFILHRRKKR